MNAITSRRVVTFVLLLTVLVILFAPRPAPIQNVRASPGVLYAAPTAQGNGDCSGWDNACTLQTALARASSGDEIWVKRGVYYPGASRTDTFALKSGVALYGGFAGTETSRDARDWRTNVTILSGDIDRNDNHGGDYINENASQIVGNNAYHVVTGSGTNASAILDGFIVTAGQADGNLSDNSGGGMFNFNGSPTLVNIIFSGNSASWNGGGMVNLSGSNSALTNVAFSGNSATYGGGMFNEYSSPTLIRVAFSGNSAEYGGGMTSYSSKPVLTNVIFNSNSAQYDGGGMYNDGSDPALINVTFSGNSAEYGGGMANYSSAPTLTSVMIWGNTADDGTGVYNDESTPSIAYSDIEGCGNSRNWNPECGTDGGGNIQADPLFINAAGGNLRLDFGSPAVDAGSPSTCPATDLDGLPRPTDGDSDGTATCDIGAYEAGTMICGVMGNGTYTFEHQSSVVITVTTRGNLDCLYVDEMEINHPAAPPNIQTGRYWLIRGLQSDQQTNATGFTVNLTLPTAFTPGLNDKVCRYTGSGWDCAAHYFTENTITREGVMVLSDWAVGRNVGPTAVVLRRLRAQDAGPVTAVAVILGLAVAFLLRQRRR